MSPKLANLYLAKFDVAATRRSLNVVRYADDFVIMCKSKHDAEQALEFSRKFLKTHLGLDLKDAKTRIVDYRGGFDFLGFRVGGGKHAPSQKSVNKLKQKITSLTDPRSGRALFPILVQLRNVIAGWHEAYRLSDLGTIPKEINEHVTAAACSYLASHEIIAQGKKLKSKQLRMLGIPGMPVR